MDFGDSLLVGGISRTYLVHVPDNSPAQALILVFHGGGGRARGMPLLTHFNRIANREGFVVAYPDGYRRHWTLIDEMQENGVDDIAFIAALIEKMARAYTIAPLKVYAAGISNGGFFVQRLVVEPEISGRISAIASVAATMPMNLSAVERLSKPISVMLIHGTDDPLVPFEGGRVRAGARRPVLSASASANKWAQLNGCLSTPAASYLPDRSGDSTRVRVENFLQCREGVEVVLYTVEGGGHTWPGGWQYMSERFIGRTSRNIDASEEIAAFFKRH